MSGYHDNIDSASTHTHAHTRIHMVAQLHAHKEHTLFATHNTINTNNPCYASVLQIPHRCDSL